MGCMRPLLLAAALLLPPFICHAADSQCYGSVSKGRIENSVALPGSGSNFTAYSALGTPMGRTRVHGKVASIVTAAYGALAKSNPDLHFVYGETGWPSGGNFKPHRSHQNGLSVDFFVPVRDAANKSVPLPTGVNNKFGYAIEFDSKARFQNLRIDFAAIAEHLYELHRAANAQGIGIAQVIFDKQYLPQLFATPRGTWVQKNITFMKAKPWVRHDEHYHVDFAVPCKPM